MLNGDEDDDLGFESQWERLNSRIEQIRQNEQRKAVDRLKLRLLKKDEKEVKRVADNNDNFVIKLPKSKSKAPPQVIPINPAPRKNKLFQQQNSLMKSQLDALKEDLDKVTLQQKDNEESKDESDHSDNENHNNNHKKNADKAGDQEKEQIITNPDNKKIGEQQQFSKIQKRNWRLITIILILAVLSSIYFFVAWLYQENVIKQIKKSEKYLRIGFLRQIEISLLYIYFRERLIFQNDNLYQFEVQAIDLFYQNEQDLKDTFLQNDQTFVFLKSFIQNLDTSYFCESLSFSDAAFNSSLNSCQAFSNGVFKQGYQSALYTFLGYYITANLTYQKLSTRNETLTLLQNKDLQSFFVAQETFLTHVMNELISKWSANTADYFDSKLSLYRLVFIFFLLFLMLLHLVIVPRIIKTMSETTWRSRGILNLLPNSIFKEMKQNKEIFKMLLA